MQVSKDSSETLSVGFFFVNTYLNYILFFLFFVEIFHFDRFKVNGILCQECGNIFFAIFRI